MNIIRIKIVGGENFPVIDRSQRLNTHERLYSNISLIDIKINYKNRLTINIKLTNIQMQQKNKQPHQKSTIVEFSNLNDNNKTQFLQFLLRNNITFEKTGAKGNDDYVAKVTLPKPNLKSNKQNNINAAKNNHSHGENTKVMNKNKPVHTKNINNTSINRSIDNSIKINTPQKTRLTNLNTSLAKNSSTPLNQNKKAINNGQSKSPKSNSHRNLRKIQKPTNNISGVKKSPITVRTTSEFLAQENLQLNTQNIKNKQLSKIEKNVKKPEPQISSKQVNKNTINEIKNKNGNKQNQNFYLQKQKTILQKSKSTQKYQKLFKKDTVQKQKILQVNNQIKRKTEQQKQICQLVNRYLKLFDLKLMGQRPIKWSFSQLVRTIEQIYNQLFIKNTQSLTQKGYSKLENYTTGNQSNSSSFIKFIKQYFANKHKNEKLATSNLINMLYSLSCYLENEKKVCHVSHFPSNILSNANNINTRQIIKEIKQNNKLTTSGIFLQIFQDFLCQIYQFEQLLFYLFIRSIIISELVNVTNNHTSVNNKGNKMQNKSGFIMQRQVYMSYKEIIKILKLIFGQDQDLREQYKLMILTRVNYHQLHPQIQQCQVKISAPQFLTILVEDYRVKRLLVQQNNQAHHPQKIQFNNSVDYHSLTSDNTFQQIAHFSVPKKKQAIPIIRNQQINNICVNINQNQTDELTFGQQTQSNIDKDDNQNNFITQKQFWESTQSTEVFNKVQQCSLQGLICDKMKKKVCQFYNILVENKSQYNSVQNKKHSDKNQNKYKSYDKKQIIELLTKKSVNLLGCIVEMNKLKWFQQLRVIDPNQDDIDKVQELQLAYRRLKCNPDADSIGKLCKNILTVSQFTIALQKLIFM